MSPQPRPKNLILKQKLQEFLIELEIEIQMLQEKFDAYGACDMYDQCFSYDDGYIAALSEKYEILNKILESN